MGAWCYSVRWPLAYSCSSALNRDCSCGWVVLQRPVAIRLQLQQSSQWGLQLCVVLQRPVAIRLQLQ